MWTKNIGAALGFKRGEGEGGGGGLRGVASGGLGFVAVVAQLCSNAGRLCFGVGGCIFRTTIWAL